MNHEKSETVLSISESGKKKVKISKERPHKYSIPKNSQQSGLVFILAVTCLRKSQIAHLKTQGLK